MTFVPTRCLGIKKIWINFENSPIIFPWSVFRIQVPPEENFSHQRCAGGSCFSLYFQRTGYGTTSVLVQKLGFDF